jgi:hypothetical protein
MPSTHRPFVVSPLYRENRTHDSEGCPIQAVREHP